MFIVQSKEIKNTTVHKLVSNNSGIIYDDSPYLADEDVQKMVNKIKEKERNNDLMKSFRDSMKLICKGKLNSHAKLFFLATMWCPTNKTKMLITKTLMPIDVSNCTLKDSYHCLFEHNSLTFEDFSKIFTSWDIGEMRLKIISHLSNKYPNTFADYLKVYSNAVTFKDEIEDASKLHDYVFRFMNNCLEKNVKILLSKNCCSFVNVDCIRIHINTLFKEFCNKNLLDDDIVINFNMLTLINKPIVKYEYYNKMLLYLIMLLFNNAKNIDVNFRHIPKTDELIRFDL